MFTTINKGSFVRRLVVYLFEEGRKLMEDVHKEEEVIGISYGIKEITKTTNGYLIFTDMPKASPVEVKENQVSFEETDAEEMVTVYRQSSELVLAEVYLTKETLAKYK